MHKLVKFAKSDPGNIVMNVGSIVSLSGFMMSDVMHLRTLSICGSFCGITYNLTRKPRQFNAVAWGLVFVGVNIYHLYYLYLERNEDMTFNPDEMLLYSCQFKQWGVEPWQFKKLVRLEGCRFRTYRRGDIVVDAGSRLGDVLMVVRGEVGAEAPDRPPLARAPLYTYRGEGHNGCVIGGTALVDPSIRSKSYPNRLVCETDGTIVVKWDTNKLAAVMETDKEVESAVLHSLYTELIQGLRRHRRNKEKEDMAERMHDRLVEFERLVDGAVKNATAENGFLKLNSKDKREVREYARKNSVTPAQRESLIWKHKWTMDEWDDGAKEILK